MRDFALMLIFVTCYIPNASAGPYAPPAGQPGSTAIPDTSPLFVEWASGFQNYVQGSPINLSFTNPAKALGPAKGTAFDVTELGNGGQITLTFDKAILASQNGPDFAVFGNGFEDTYEKLAYVDVSQDGQHWLRMPNHDLTPAHVSTFGLTDPTNIDGLAGKYRAGFGVPFSLNDVGLAWASYVRLVDIVGDGSAKDSSGNPIYDPYPNDNGFNVGGVGVLSAVPEPASFVLLAAGAALAWLIRAKIRQRAAIQLP
ncbi:MAG TPA: PEP-CTERM sorting domain-containing protein [Pirellulales bacterium]|jgi:hypothetical protein|nr:PEP-CTERM sorting domain-containing protein [Pirellulales bacterium]